MWTTLRKRHEEFCWINYHRINRIVQLVIAVLRHITWLIGVNNHCVANDCHVKLIAFEWFKNWAEKKVPQSFRVELSSRSLSQLFAIITKFCQFYEHLRLVYDKVVSTKQNSRFCRSSVTIHSPVSKMSQFEDCSVDETCPTWVDYNPILKYAVSYRITLFFHWKGVLSGICILLCPYVFFRARNDGFRHLTKFGLGREKRGTFNKITC